MGAKHTTHHSFHLPVMGVGFTVDAPLRLGRFGISSVISLVDDRLLEQVREHYCQRWHEPFEPISNECDDARARRVTAYLDFVDGHLRAQSAALRQQAFAPGTELTRYFELLPPGELREAYQHMLATTDWTERVMLEGWLREQVVAGSIDVNIMTKLDRDTDARGRARERGKSDALAAVRGFARSTVRGSVVLSAGMNPRLYTYMGTLPELAPDATGAVHKPVVLKVSDYRSALVQGKFLAKRGIWVSEYRVESGLNCGGHAFATTGLLLGPILEEFKQRRAELAETVFGILSQARVRAGLEPCAAVPEVRVTVQGGIGTAAEDALLRELYEVDGTGWGTPFLLVPEVTSVDPETRAALAASRGAEVQLSESSPLGVPFWNLMSSPSERARRQRIDDGRPGSPCPKGFVAISKEFGDVPLCPASRTYQKQKLAELRASGLDPAELAQQEVAVQSKSCICHDLGGGTTTVYGIDAKATPAICPGPNITSFDRVMSLDELVGHIYGRCDMLAPGHRPHMFVRELELYIDDYRARVAAGDESAKYAGNLLAGIAHYCDAVAPYLGGAQADSFLADLRQLSGALEQIRAPAPIPIATATCASRP